MFRLSLAIKECVKECNVYFLRSKQKEILSTSQQSRRQELLAMMGSGGKVYFAVPRDCATMFLREFGFSSDVHKSPQRTRTMCMLRNATSMQWTTPSAQSLHYSLRNTKQRTTVSFLKPILRLYSDCMSNRNEQNIPYHQKLDSYEGFVSKSSNLHDIEPQFIAYIFRVRIHQGPTVEVSRTSIFSRCSLCEDLDVAGNAAIGRQRDTNL